MITINFKKITEEAVIPTYGNIGDLCFDFYSLEETTIFPQRSYTFKTGLIWEPKFDEIELSKAFKIGLLIKPRSSLALNGNIIVMGGVIDSGYRNEIKIILHNIGFDNYCKINRNDRIAQGHVVISPIVNIQEVNELDMTEDRGGGFGSTGT